MGRVEAQVEELADNRVRLTVEVPQADLKHAVEHATSDLAATVSVQPKPEPADWSKLEVPYAEPEVPSEVVDQELEELRASVAELAPVEGRAARTGDVAVIDVLDASGEGQRDLVVELGSGRLLEEIERALIGASPGETKTLEVELADGSKSSADVTLSELKEKVLPPLDDELARAASEFDTLAELRADIERRIREVLEEEAATQFRAAAVDELVRASKVEPGGPLVEARTRELLNALGRSLERRGVTAESYLQLSGQTGGQLVERLGAEAQLSVARELVL